MTCTCGAEIVFIVTRSGKKMPCDPEHLTEWVTEKPSADYPQKRITLQDEGGDLQSGWRSPMLKEGAQEISGYVPHWSTCVKADEFRRRR